MKIAIEVKDIKKSIKDGNKTLDILKGLNLTVEEGKIIGIVGKSGSGKSTLLAILSLLDTDYTGNYILENEKIDGIKMKDLFDKRLKNIANIFQSFQLVEDLNVLQNVEMPLGYRNIKKKKRMDDAKDAINLVGLKGREKTNVQNLSGGEQQRVAIARAIALKPKILLADEPTGNLDDATSREIIDLLFELNRKYNLTMIIVTHDMDIAKRCDKFYTLKDGILHE